MKKTPLKIVYSSMRNQRTDFPVIACAVSCLDGAYRASVGARPAKAMLIHDEEGLLNAGINEESAQAFAEYTAKAAPTSSNVRASAEYRTHLIKALTARACKKLGGI
jgi:CO/xanthine dehydrogenase FAD-binding subunit